MEMKLRKYLWTHHGCNVASLYADDGEMQCGKCIIDFKRDSEDVIINKITASKAIAQQTLNAPAPTESTPQIICSNRGCNKVATIHFCNDHLNDASF